MYDTPPPSLGIAYRKIVICYVKSLVNFLHQLYRQKNNVTEIPFQSKLYMKIPLRRYGFRWCFTSYDRQEKSSDIHLPKARVESCSAATTLALYVKNFPGWPTLFPSHWGRPIRELAYTVTYYFDTMNDLNMYAIYLPKPNGLRGRMDKTLAFWSRGREFNPRSRQLFFLSVIWRDYYFLFF